MEIFHDEKSFAKKMEALTPLELEQPGAALAQVEPNGKKVASMGSSLMHTLWENRRAVGVAAVAAVGYGVINGFAQLNRN